MSSRLGWDAAVIAMESPSHPRPPNRFQTKDEAEDYALTMGENWIDQKNPLP